MKRILAVLALCLLIDRVGEIRIASDGRVYGFEAFVKRMARRGRVW